MQNLTILIILLCHLIIKSQVSTINLTVIDSSDNKPIEFAACILTNSTTKKQQSSITDSKGLLKFKNMDYGLYYLDVNIVGYIPIKSAEINIKQPEINITKYLVNIDASLSEVKIVEKREAIVYDGDKTIVNVGSDIGNDGGNVKDVIENAPGIHIDNNNVISLMGSPGVKVLINGRESNRTKNMKTFLENLKASMIDKVEIMTNPPARYSAEGTAGVINIILKKGVDEFLYGSISTQIDRFGTTGATLDLGHSNDHFSINGTLNGEYTLGNGYGVSSLINNSEDTSYIQKSYDKSSWKGPSITPSINFDYFINEKNTLSASLGYFADWNYYKSDEYDSFFTQTNYQNLLVSRYSKGKAFSNGFNASMDYEKKLKNEEDNLTFSISFENSKSNENTDFTDNATGINPYFKKRINKSNDKDLNIDSRIELNKQLDSNWNLTSGFQCTYDHVNNQYELLQDYQLNNDFKTINKNNFLFYQYVNSLYTTVIGKYGIFKLNAGIRFEHTYNTGQTNSKDFKNTYYGFYPNVSITAKINKSSKITFSYNRRLMRPWVWMLQENTFSSDDRNVWSGNSDLKPAISNNYNLSYNYNLNKWNINLNVFMSDKYNSIAWNQIKLINGVVYRGSGNFGAARNIGSYLYINYKPFKSWDITGGLSASYNIIDKSTSVFVNNRYEFNTFASLKNQWKIKKHIIILSDMWYSPKLKTNTGYSVNMFSFDLAFKLLLLKNKLGITISGENITNTGNWGNTFIGKDYVSSSKWYYNRPNVQLTIIYHFGKDKKEDDTINKSSGGGKGGMDGGR